MTSATGRAHAAGEASTSAGTTEVHGPRTPGRPTRLPRSARRRQLLAAAQDVFVAQGYHAAAMDDIAERAGVSKPVLYQHFPGKLELYLALLDTHCDAIVEKVRAAMAATTDNKERVRGAVRAYFDFVDHENEPAVRERVDRVERLCIEALTATIMADTGVSRARAELLAAGLTGAAETAAQFWLAGGRQVPKDEAEQLLAALNWRGIASFPLQGEAASGEASGRGEAGEASGKGQPGSGEASS
jgi:AcrR family transcriptional regulator